MIRLFACIALGLVAGDLTAMAQTQQLPPRRVITDPANVAAGAAASVIAVDALSRTARTGYDTSVNADISTTSVQRPEPQGPGASRDYQRSFSSTPNR